MKRLLSGLFAAAALLGCVFPSAHAAPESAPPAAVTSTQERGVVTAQPDAALVDGRLAMKVVAFNRTAAPASFGPENVEVYTAAGKRVELVSLEQLVKEVTANASGRGRSEHDPASYSGADISRNSAGEPDVGNYTGSRAPMSGVVSPQTHAASGAGSSPAVQQQIADLKAALLQPLSVAPKSAAGGQVVTQELKFKRKDDRTLRVVVDFNGERHELSFAAPK